MMITSMGEEILEAKVIVNSYALLSCALIDGVWILPHLLNLVLVVLPKKKHSHSHLLLTMIEWLLLFKPIYILVLTQTSCKIIYILICCFSLQLSMLARSNCYSLMLTGLAHSQVLGLMSKAHIKIITQASQSLNTYVSLL